MRLWFAPSSNVPIYRQLATQVSLAILCGDLRRASTSPARESSRDASPCIPTPSAPAIVSWSATSIRNFQYTTEVARHLGVLPAMAVGLVRRRERKHFSYFDASNTPQAAVFEVPKREPRGLLAILRARAPQACAKTPQHVCGGFIPE